MKRCLKEYYPSMPKNFQIWCNDPLFKPERIFYTNDYYTYSYVNIITTQWCKDFTDEEKMIWVLRFGDHLPEYVQQLGIIYE